ncbi:IS5 family transposase [Deinococcus sedimenti]|uniref:IS5 family transposase n=1 Tax=Deinococcus sedimenti TaxID=1867090 RepID=UPI003570ABD8
MSRRTDLTESQWLTLQPPQPPRGQRYADHRMVVNGIPWRLKTAAPWREIRKAYGPWETCHARMVRWESAGIRTHILRTRQCLADMAGHIDWHAAALDSTRLRAHQSAVGARSQQARDEPRDPVPAEWLGLSRGGRTTNIQRCADGLARPLSLVLSERQRADGPLST